MIGANHEAYRYKKFYEINVNVVPGSVKTDQVVVTDFMVVTLASERITLFGKLHYSERMKRVERFWMDSTDEAKYARPGSHITEAAYSSFGRIRVLYSCIFSEDVRPEKLRFK